MSTTHSRRVRLAFAAGLAAAGLVLAGCSSDSGSDSGGGAAGSIDCTVATSAIEAYSTALTDMVIGLTDDDVDAARAGAEAFGPAALDVTRALPGLPAEAEDFVTRSEEGSRLVLDSLADGVSGDVILDELDVLFSDEAFTTAGDAIDDLYGSNCSNTTPE